MRAPFLFLFALKSLGLVALASTPTDPLAYFRDLAETRNYTLGRPVAAGRFGADMQVSLVNDGPVTLLIDSHQRD